MLYSIGYISNSVALLNSGELENLSTFIMEHRKNYDISGILIYQGGTFFQVLEGEKRRIDLLFHKIKSEERHNSITNIVNDPIESRMFTDYNFLFNEMENYPELLKFYSNLMYQGNSGYGNRLTAFIRPFLNQFTF